MDLKKILADHVAWCANSTKGQRADLMGVNLVGANLAGADLRDADLVGVNLRDANLRGANLRDADLVGVNLRDADLMGVNLRDADLMGVNLVGANLRGADLRGVKHVVSAGYCDGHYVFGYLGGRSIMIRAGCRTKSIAEARAYWANKPDRREIHDACTWIERVFKLRGLVD